MSDDVIWELTSADLPGALALLTDAGLTLSEVHETSPLTVRFKVCRKDMDSVSSLIDKRGDSLRQISRSGYREKLKTFSRHWILILGVTVLLVLTAWLPTKVLFIRIEGNQFTSTRRILEKAEDCGIVFGANRGEVRSEKVKNALLEAIPELQWAGVNTYGCVAVITVEERQLPEKGEPQIPGHLIANRDAIILEMTVLKGTASVQVGQAVRKGEMLISGYSDCGNVLLLQGAQGEAYGRTMRKIQAKTLDQSVSRAVCYEKKQKFSLMIGKKRINFYEDSGILDTGCVKMYQEYCLMLPGGFSLPVRLVVETETQYHLMSEPSDPLETEAMLFAQAREYLISQMIAGSVLSSRESAEGFHYTGEFVCREMIGRMIYEEIITNYGENR